jgi:hypothetical protein
MDPFTSVVGQKRASPEQPVGSANADLIRPADNRRFQYVKSPRRSGVRLATRLARRAHLVAALEVVAVYNCSGV